MKLILFGAPGAGKGTQASAISEALHIPTVSTGNIIREAIAKGTEAGLKARQYTDRGALVPDEVVVKMLSDRISQSDCANGYILDGFPRTIPQAEALNKMGVRIDKVVEIDLSDDKIVARMSGRRVCEKCGASYHLLYKKPKVEGVCDECAGTLLQRKDDHPDTVKERLRVYHEQTEPLKDFYAKQAKLVSVNGSGEISEITKQILSVLEV